MGQRTSTTPAPGEGEQVLWHGRPSQVLHFWTYVLGILFSWLLVPLGFALWRWLDTRNHQYELTSERIRLRTGILNKRTDHLELYRVRDTVVEEPFLYRLFGAGNITMVTSDRTHPEFKLEAVKDPHAIHEHIRRQVELMRQRKRVREVDFEGGDPVD